MVEKARMKKRLTLPSSAATGAGSTVQRGKESDAPAVGCETVLKVRRVLTALGHGGGVSAKAVVAAKSPEKSKARKIMGLTDSSSATSHGGVKRELE